MNEDKSKRTFKYLECEACGRKIKVDVNTFMVFCHICAPVIEDIKSYYYMKIAELKNKNIENYGE